MNVLQNARKPDWWFYAGAILVVVFLLFHLLLFYGAPGLRPVLYLFGGFLLTAFAVLFLAIAIIHALVKRPFFNKWRIIGFSLLLFIPLAYLLKSDTGGFLVRTYPSSFVNHKSRVSFRLPMQDSIAVAWGGDKIAHNYHAAYADQRWAYDFLVIKNGNSFSGDSTLLESYYCYGQPVLAPASGTVVGITDSLPNVAIGATDILSPCGNHIVLRVAEKEYLFMCHLKPASVAVKVGDSIQQGQVLAQIGNSGNTSEPHLHIHLQHSADQDFGEGVPLLFDNYYSKGNLVRRGMPKGGFGADGRFIGETIIHAGN